MSTVVKFLGFGYEIFGIYTANQFTVEFLDSGVNLLIWCLLY